MSKSAPGLARHAPHWAAQAQLTRQWPLVLARVHGRSRRKRGRRCRGIRHVVFLQRLAILIGSQCRQGHRPRRCPHGCAFDGRTMRAQAAASSSSTIDLDPVVRTIATLKKIFLRLKVAAL
ncbi:hypothetical protein [Bradyrhizobium oligotrophicum]|uniref:hypothetical protein n=1 Tax=Bradyrhizobium oligotrophicum TaxID=44255 RepID=UPI003EC117A6